MNPMSSPTPTEVALTPESVAAALFDMQWFDAREFQAALKVGPRTFQHYIADGVVPKRHHAMGQKHVWTGAQVRETKTEIEMKRGVEVCGLS